MGALRERTFRVLFAGQAASSFGNALVPVALAFAVLRLTHSAADLGFVLGAEAVANVAIVLFGGVVADRFSRRGVMVAADSLRGAGEVSLGVILITAHPPLILVAVLAAIQGIGSAMFSPAASGFTPAVVSTEYLQQANALRQTANAVASVIGPAVAGVCVATVGAGWAILADGATFLVNVVALVRIDVEVPRRQRATSMLTDLRAGWAYFARRKWFRTMVIGASLFNLLYGAYLVLGPVASLRLYSGVAMWAVSSVAAGIGSIAAGLAIAKTSGRRNWSLRSAVALVALFALAPSLMAIHAVLAAVAAAAAVGGGGVTAFAAIWETTIQQQIPEHLRSRALSYDYFGSLVALPAGLAMTGPLVAVIGIKPLLWLVAVAEILTIAVLTASSSIRTFARQPRPLGDGGQAR